MTIDKRLTKIVNEIKGDTLVDVGCDHGKVSCEALLQNKVNKVIATDISEKSLKKCKDLAKKLNLKNIEFRCGDGFEVIKDNEADVACIAGMGGYEIIKILKSIPKGIKRIILCPHQDTEVLREFLSEKFVISKDEIIYLDKHFYSLIVLKEGKEKLTQKQIYFGKDRIENKDYVSYLLAQKDKFLKILERILPEERRVECEAYISMIDEELNGSKKDI